MQKRSKPPQSPSPSRVRAPSPFSSRSIPPRSDPHKRRWDNEDEIPVIPDSFERFSAPFRPPQPRQSFYQETQQQSSSSACGYHLSSSQPRPRTQIPSSSQPANRRFSSLDSPLSVYSPEGSKENDESFYNEQFKYSSVQQNAYFLLKLWLISHIRVLTFCFKVRTGEIKKRSNEKILYNKVFGDYYGPTVEYLHKITNCWKIKRDWSNWTQSKLQTLATELKQGMETFMQVCAEIVCLLWKTFLFRIQTSRK